MDTDRNRRIRKASLTAVAGNGTLAAAKVAAGLVAGSMAVVGDGIDTSSDVLASFVTLVAVQIMAKPPDRTHPYGHSRAETVATKIVAFFLFFVGAQLAMTSVTRILQAQELRVPSPLALYVTGVSIAGKILLAWNQFRASRRTSSPMLEANAKNMLNDIFISCAVLGGLVFTLRLELPIVDLLLAAAVSLWIMKTAVRIHLETNLEVMEGLADQHLYEEIFVAVAEVPGAYNPHRTRVRKIGNMYVIDLDIEVDGGLTVLQAHDVAQQVEERIKTSIRNVYDIMVHVEPLGNVEEDEKY
ncbi:MAG: cation diffusion facilitator family transporter, partial [Spirochaetota bacterium]